jgi:hypothetical protein
MDNFKYLGLNFLNCSDMENQYNEMRRAFENEAKVMMLKSLAHILYPQSQAEIYCRQIDEAEFQAKCLDVMGRSMRNAYGSRCWNC